MGWGDLRTRGTRYVRPSLIARRIEAFNFVSKSDAPAGMELADAVVSPLGKMLLGRGDSHRPEHRPGEAAPWSGRGEWGKGLIVLPHE
jgi:hypothetical protein